MLSVSFMAMQIKFIVVVVAVVVVVVVFVLGPRGAMISDPCSQ